MSQLTDITKRKQEVEDLHGRLLATVIQAAQGIAPETCAALLETYREMNRLRHEELQLIATGKVTHSEKLTETASDAPGSISAPITVPNAADA